MHICSTNLEKYGLQDLVILGDDYIFWNCNEDFDIV